MKKIILKIEGMTCSACSNHIEKYVSKQKGIIDVSVNLVMGTALIHYEDDISIDTLASYIKNSGYTYKGIYKEEEKNKKDRSILILIALGLFMILIMYLSMAHMFHFPEIPALSMKENPKNHALALLICTIPYFIYGKDIFIKGIKNLFLKSPNMDTLVSLGVLTSFLYSFVNVILLFFGRMDAGMHLYFESVCMMILFVKLGRTIDQHSKEKTKEAIKELVKVTPESALLKKNGKEQETTIDEVKIGDLLIVKPGMKVAVDGIITDGTAHFDESFITGESTPIKKQVGNKIVAGSMNYDGVVEYKAEKIGPKSTISEMVHLVLEASNSKMPISRIADKISAYFVPSIIILAVLTLIGNLIFNASLNEALITMVTVLVVACPCALGLATPLAVVTSIGASAKSNLLIKSSETLEMASHIDTIIFDKTGTLTYGTPQIAAFYNHSNYDKETLLNIISNIESKTSHPLAKAFQNEKRENLKVEDFKELPGRGIKAKVNNKKYVLGNRSILKDQKNPYQKEEEKLTKEKNSIIYVMEENEIIALIGVKDIVRKETIQTIETLKKANYDVIMLTGDNETTAKQIAKELQIDKVVSDVLPSDKTAYIKELQKQGKKVMMVGDGINDAPSLVTADIGISLKSSTDIASNSASVIITNDDLGKIPIFLQIGKRTLTNIKENLFWAFFYNALMIPVAMGLLKKFGIEISPMIASAAMMLSSLCVVGNALRLRKIK